MVSSPLLDRPGGGVPYADVPIEEVEEDFLQLKAHLAAGECRSLLLLAQIEQRGTWRTAFRSIGHWLSAVAGIDPATGAARVRVARRLQHLPLVTEAFAAGRLTYSQTRAISRALRHGADPDREAELVEVAAHATAAQLEVICRVIAGRSDDDADRAEDAIALHVTRHAGGGRITIDLPDVDLDRFLAAVDRRVQDEPAPDPDVALEPLARRRALAAVDLAVTASGEPDDCPAVNVIIPLADHEAHLSGALADRPVAAAVIDRLICNGTTRGIVVDETGKPVMAGSKIRNGTLRQRAAVHARDGGRCTCCGSRWRIELHHVELWSTSKRTQVDRLVTLCRRCHHDHHHGRFTITIHDQTGDVQLWTPTGDPLHRPTTITGSADGLTDSNRRAGVAIDHDRCRSRWDGGHLDTRWIPGPKHAPLPHRHVPRDAIDGFELWNPSDDDWHIDTTDADRADAQAEADALDFLRNHRTAPTEHVPRNAIDEH